MTRRRCLSRVIAHLAVLAALCASCAESPATGTRRVRVGYAGEADFGDLPSLVAHARLRSRGYEVEVTNFSASDVAVDAVSRGTIDVFHGSIVSAWTAIGRGARIRTVMDHTANPYRLVAAPGITSCAGLDGRRVALPSDSAVSTHLVRAFLNEDCPSAKPEILLLSESSNRAVAFLSGRVDGGALELSSLLWLQSQAPKPFQVLSDFSTRWPRIKTTGVHVNAAFADSHNELLRDYVRALLAANRDVQADPSLLVSIANEKLGRSEDWPSAARAYLGAHAWPEQGGLTVADAEETLRFFKTYSHLDQQLTAAMVVDLTVLEGVLGKPR